MIERNLSSTTIGFKITEELNAYSAAPYNAILFPVAKANSTDILEVPTREEIIRDGLNVTITTIDTLEEFALTIGDDGLQMQTYYTIFILLEDTAQPSPHVAAYTTILDGFDVVTQPPGDLTVELSSTFETEVQVAPIEVRVTFSEPVQNFTGDSVDAGGATVCIRPGQVGDVYDIFVYPDSAGSILVVIEADAVYALEKPNQQSNFLTFTFAGEAILSDCEDTARPTVELRAPNALGEISYL